VKIDNDNISDKILSEILSLSIFTYKKMQQIIIQ